MTNSHCIQPEKLPSHLAPLKFDKGPLTYILNLVHPSGYDRILRALVQQSASDGWKLDDFEQLLSDRSKFEVRCVVHALLQLDKIAVYCRRHKRKTSSQFRYFLHNPINDEPELYTDWQEVVIYNQE